MENNLLKNLHNDVFDLHKDVNIYEKEASKLGTYSFEEMKKYISEVRELANRHEDVRNRHDDLSNTRTKQTLVVRDGILQFDRDREDLDSQIGDAIVRIAETIAKVCDNNFTPEQIKILRDSSNVNCEGYGICWFCKNCKNYSDTFMQYCVECEFIDNSKNMKKLTNLKKALKIKDNASEVLIKERLDNLTIHELYTWVNLLDENSYRTDDPYEYSYFTTWAKSYINNHQETKSTMYEVLKLIETHLDCSCYICRLQAVYQNLPCFHEGCENYIGNKTNIVIDTQYQYLTHNLKEEHNLKEDRLQLRNHLIFLISSLLSISSLLTLAFCIMSLIKKTI